MLTIETLILSGIYACRVDCTLDNDWDDIIQSNSPGYKDGD
jgi:hypothetical protein